MFEKGAWQEVEGDHYAVAQKGSPIRSNPLKTNRQNGLDLRFNQNGQPHVGWPQPTWSSGPHKESEESRKNQDELLTGPSIILCSSRYDRSIAISMSMPIVWKSDEKGETKGKSFGLTGKLDHTATCMFSARKTINTKIRIRYMVTRLNEITH